MKIGKFARVLLAAAPLLAGCGDFWQAPSSTTSTTTTTTSLTSGYFYIIDQSTSQLVSYYDDAGTLTEVTSVALPSEPYAIAVAPNKEFLYVSTAGGIFLYTLSSGTPTLYSSTAIISDTATAIAVDVNSEWLLESYTVSGTAYLTAIPVSSSTGVSNGTAQAVSFTGTSINQLAISPNDKYVFVAGGTSGTSAFAFTYTSSTPLGSSAYQTISPENSTGAAALSVAVDPSNRMLYVGEADSVSSSGGLRAFTIASGGTLSEISSPLSSGGTGPHAILPKSTGDYVYVANWNGTSAGNITTFEIAASGSSYTLTKLSTTASTGAEPMGLAEDSSRQFVMAVNQGSPYLDVYVFDTTTPSELDTTATSTAFVGYGIAAEQ